jgi:hypothetical protein
VILTIIAIQIQLVFELQRKGVSSEDTAIIYDLFTCPEHYSGAPPLFPNRIIQVLELVTPLDKIGNLFIDNQESLTKTLYQIIERILAINMSYTDIKSDNTGLTIDGQIKLIDLETIRYGKSHFNFSRETYKSFIENIIE